MALVSWSRSRSLLNGFRRERNEEDPTDGSFSSSGLEDEDEEAILEEAVLVAALGVHVAVPRRRLRAHEERSIMNRVECGLVVPHLGVDKLVHVQQEVAVGHFAN